MDSSFYCVQETHLRIKDRHYLSVKRWKKVLGENGTKKQYSRTVSISDKLDFKLSIIKRDREEQALTVIKRITYHMDFVICTIYATNKKASEFIKEMILQAELYSHPHILIVGDGNITLSPIVGLSK